MLAAIQFPELIQAGKFGKHPSCFASVFHAFVAQWPTVSKTLPLVETSFAFWEIDSIIRFVTFQGVLQVRAVLQLHSNSA